MTVKEARIQKGYTQEEISRYLGIPKRTIENWEAGSRKCPDYVERLVVEKILSLDPKKCY